MKIRLIVASLLAFGSTVVLAEQAAESPWMMVTSVARLSPANESSGSVGAGIAIHIESKTIPDISFGYSFTKNNMAKLDNSSWGPAIQIGFDYKAGTNSYSSVDLKKSTSNPMSKSLV